MRKKQILTFLNGVSGPFYILDKINIIHYNIVER